MKILNSKYQIVTEINGIEILKRIERAGRICYKSEDKITNDSAIKFVDMILRSGHESVIEHQSISVHFVFDRGISHEIVRQRLASFSQESTRFINYTKENRGGECSFINIEAHLKNALSFQVWLNHMAECERVYKQLIDFGESPQIARSVLPNSLKTEIMVTTNLREWRLIFKQRSSIAAHPQMREVIIPLLNEFKSLIPVIFDDIKI